MQGQGYAWTPGITAAEQVDRLAAGDHGGLHEPAGSIFLQLGMVGASRIVAAAGPTELPVAASPSPPAGNAFHRERHGRRTAVPFVRPRALQIEEIALYVEQYATAAPTCVWTPICSLFMDLCGGVHCCCCLRQWLSHDRSSIRAPIIATDAYGGDGRSFFFCALCGAVADGSGVLKESSAAIWLLFCFWPGPSRQSGCRRLEPSMISATIDSERPFGTIAASAQRPYVSLLYALVQ